MMAATMTDKPRSPWRIPLVREIALVLLLKLVLLFSIKAIWFDAPTVPRNGTQRIDQKFFGPDASSAPPAAPLSSSVPEP